MNNATTPGKTLGQAIIEIVGNIQRAKGIRAKEKILVTGMGQVADDYHQGEELFKRLLQWIYDDTQLLGVKAIEVDITHKVAGDMAFGEWVFGQLDAVAAASGPGSTATRQHHLNNIYHHLRANNQEIILSWIINKDMRCGIANSTIGRAFPKLLTTFGCMLAAPFVAKKVKGWPVGIEPKYDGMRVLAHYTGSEVKFYTRSGKVIESLNLFKEEVAALAVLLGDGAPIYLDGEVTSGSFLESLSAARSEKQDVTDGTLWVFDHLPGDFLSRSEEALRAWGTFSERRKRLGNGFAAFNKVPRKFLKITPLYYASDEDEVAAYYAQSRAQKYEGVIIKDLESPYVNKRSPAWMKVKGEETEDLRVVGAFEGTGKYQGKLGGLIIDRQGVKVEVGSGFSDEQRETFWRLIQKDLALIAADNRAECSLIDQFIEVQFQEVMPSGSLRHPVFVRLRLDKSAGGAIRF